jgi:hypothetical protein
LRPFAVGGAGGLLIGPEDVEEAHAAGSRSPIGILRRWSLVSAPRSLHYYYFGVL